MPKIQRILRQYRWFTQPTEAHSSSILSHGKISNSHLDDPTIFHMSLVPCGMFQAFIILSLKNCFLNYYFCLLILTLYHQCWTGKETVLTGVLLV